MACRWCSRNSHWIDDSSRHCFFLWNLWIQDKKASSNQSPAVGREWWEEGARAGTGHTKWVGRIGLGPGVPPGVKGINETIKKRFSKGEYIKREWETMAQRKNAFKRNRTGWETEEEVGKGLYPGSPASLGGKDPPTFQGVSSSGTTGLGADCRHSLLSSRGIDGAQSHFFLEGKEC